ncbi:MAG: ABC transporter substrate-binding protein [Candidatus Saccharicenans sp.]
MKKNQFKPQSEKTFLVNNSSFSQNDSPLIKSSWVSRFFLLPIVILNLFIFGPENSRGQAISSVDDFGHRLELKGCPQKIISLAPNLTEILFSLGLNQQVIGVTRFCDYPPEARSKEIIGGLIDPNLEKIEFLQPDLVLGFRGNSRPVLEKLYARRLPLAAFNIGKTFDDLFQLITKIAQLTCRQEQSLKLISDLQSRLKIIDSSLSHLKLKNPRPKVFLTLYGQGSGLWTCGGDSYLNYLLEKAMVKNVASNLRGNWLTYSREKLIKDDPEIILILSQNREIFNQAKQWFLSQSVLKKIKAVKNETFIFLDENLFSRFGPRLVEAYEQLIKALYPELSLEEK